MANKKRLNIGVKSYSWWSCGELNPGPKIATYKALQFSLLINFIRGKINKRI